MAKEKETKVFQVRHSITREEDGERIVFEKYEDGWKYHAPLGQDHTVEQVEIILDKLKELNQDALQKDGE